MKNRKWLQRAAQAAESKMPDNTGFILMGMPLGGEDPRVFYVSNINREDAINVLKEWLIKSSGEEDWMKHIK